jgi:ABC-2 type transport system permease protein
MIGVIGWLTVGQLVRQRRALLLVLLAAIPVGVSLLYRFAGGDRVEYPQFVANTLAHFIVGLVLPLTALVIGTAALGQEIEDGTALYLLSKPIARWKVVVAKLVAAWLVTSMFVGAAVLGAGAMLFTEDQQYLLVPAFLVATCFGALIYCGLFVSLSVRFNHALIIGLAYVFVWETLVAQFVTGVRFLSIRAYTLAIAGAITDAPDAIFKADLEVTAAAILASIVIAVTLAYAIRQLRSFELSERA